MHTTSWKKLATAIPRDSTAARVVNQKGVTIPPPSVPSSKSDEFSSPSTIPVPPNFDDITGRRYGFYTVIGLHQIAERPSENGGSEPFLIYLWVVRCDCSRYRIKNKKALKNAKHLRIGCSFCRGFK